MLVKSIEVQIYSLDVIVCITESFKEAIKKFKLNDLDPNSYDEEALAFSYASDHTGKLEIYLVFKPSDLSYDTVIHELTHLTSYWCKHRGIVYDEDNDEPIAYFNGYVGGKVMEIIEKFKKQLISESK